jgi:hypothetical protein
MDKEENDVYDACHENLPGGTDAGRRWDSLMWNCAAMAGSED